MTSCVGLESLAVEPGLGSGRRKLSFRCSREPSSLHSSWLLGFPTSSEISRDIEFGFVQAQLETADQQLRTSRAREKQLESRPGNRLL